MKNLDKYKKELLFLVVLSVVIGVAEMLWNSNYYIPDYRQGSDAVSINDKLVSQEIDLQHTDNIKVSVGTEETKNSSDEIEIRVIQDDLVQSRTYLVNQLKEFAWQPLQLVLDKRFHTGRARVEIICHGTASRINVQLKKNSTEKRIAAATYDHQETGKYLYMFYRHFAWKTLPIYVVLNFLSCSLLFFAAMNAKKYLKQYPLAVTASGVFFYYYLVKGFYATAHIDGWIRSVYMMDYRYGFINRGVIGTAVSVLQKIFTGTTNISDHVLKIYIGIATVLITCLVVYVLYCFEKNMNQYSDSLIKKYSMVFLFSPMFFTYYLAGGSSYGRLDIYLIVCYLFSVMAIFRRRFLWAVPLLSVFGVLIYQIYAVCFLPMVVVLYLHLCYESPTAKNRVGLGITLIGTVLTLIAVHFGEISSINAMMYYHQQEARASAGLDFYVTTAYAFGTGLFCNDYDLAVNHLHYRYFLLILFSVPIWGIPAWLLLEKFRIETNLQNKILSGSFILSPVAVWMFFFVETSDFQRYFVDWFFSFWIGFYVLYLREHNVMRILLSSFDSRLKEQYSTYSLLIIVAYGFYFDMNQQTSWPFGTLVDTVVRYTAWVSNLGGL